MGEDLGEIILIKEGNKKAKDRSREGKKCMTNSV